jgi:hypothetical protein
MSAITSLCVLLTAIIFPPKIIRMTRQGVKMGKACCTYSEEKEDCKAKAKPKGTARKI